MTDIELFDKCIEVILKNEGGYVNHPADPGGETNYGICKRYFPNEDIKNMTKGRAKELYYEHYWKPMSLFGILDQEAVLQIFDFGVNAGIKRAIKTAQKIVRVDKDGICGNITRHAINKCSTCFLTNYKRARIKYYEMLAFRKPELRVFLSGWIIRVGKTKFA